MFAVGLEQFFIDGQALILPRRIRCDFVVSVVEGAANVHAEPPIKRPVVVGEILVVVRIAMDKAVVVVESRRRIERHFRQFCLFVINRQADFDFVLSGHARAVANFETWFAVGHEAFRLVPFLTVVKEVFVIETADAFDACAVLLRVRPCDLRLDFRLRGIVGLRRPDVQAEAEFNSPPDIWSKRRIFEITHFQRFRCVQKQQPHIRQEDAAIEVRLHASVQFKTDAVFQQVLHRQRIPWTAMAEALPFLHGVFTADRHAETAYGTAFHQ